MQQDAAENTHMEEFFSEVSAIKVKVDHSEVVQKKSMLSFSFEDISCRINSPASKCSRTSCWPLIIKAK